MKTNDQSWTVEKSCTYFLGSSICNFVSSKTLNERGRGNMMKWINRIASLKNGNLFSNPFLLFFKKWARAASAPWRFTHTFHDLENPSFDFSVFPINPQYFSQKRRFLLKTIHCWAALKITTLFALFFLRLFSHVATLATNAHTRNRRDTSVLAKKKESLNIKIPSSANTAKIQSAKVTPNGPQNVAVKNELKSKYTSLLLSGFLGFCSFWFYSFVFFMYCFSCVPSA